ncbi:unnamed protein product [Rotaria sp. Silwood1]|nr:unnamed protein product [Rotaria sp. Silwood1]
MLQVTSSTEETSMSIISRRRINNNPVSKNGRSVNNNKFHNIRMHFKKRRFSKSRKKVVNRQLPNKIVPSSTINDPEQLHSDLQNRISSLNNRKQLNQASSITSHINSPSITVEKMNSSLNDLENEYFSNKNDARHPLVQVHKISRMPTNSNQTTTPVSNQYEFYINMQK